MEDGLVKFSKFTEKDLGKACPKLVLDIKLRDDTISTTLSSLVIFTLRRENDDAVQGPVIFSWTSQGDRVPWNSFTLLQHTTSGLQEVKVEKSQRYIPEDTLTENLIVGKDDLRQLDRGEEETFWLTLPEQLHRALAPSERYTLYWPGAEVLIWQTGSIDQNQGSTLARSVEGQRLIIPAGGCVTFEAIEESVAWPDRATVEAQHGFREANSLEESWRWKNMLLPRSKPNPKSRVIGAPILDVSIEGPNDVAQGGAFESLKFTLTVTYRGKREDSHEIKPIVFHLKSFTFHGKQLTRKTQMGWEVMDPEQDGLLFVDDPDISVKVGDHQDFISLKPGESWSWEEDVGICGYGMMPNNPEVGDVFRYTFLEDKVDWWDWGSKDDHASTTVKLPCFVTGPVQKPKENDGRPALIIPSSNSAEVKIV